MASRDSKLRAASGNPAPTPNDSIVALTKPRSLPCAGAALLRQPTAPEGVAPALADIEGNLFA
jgi:hypothetical protein